MTTVTPGTSVDEETAHFAEDQHDRFCSRGQDCATANDEATLLAFRIQAILGGMFPD